MTGDLEPGLERWMPLFQRGRAGQMVVAPHCDGWLLPVGVTCGWPMWKLRGVVTVAEGIVPSRGRCGFFYDRLRNRTGWRR